MRRVVTGELARAEDIPQKFLEQILLDLKRSGIVASRRGKVGGYMLIKNPREIFFGEVLRHHRWTGRAAAVLEQNCLQEVR